MKPTVKLAEGDSPKGGKLQLYSHDQTFYLSIGGEIVASTALCGADEELGRMACQPFRQARQPVLLIGGLGLGVVLKGVLESVTQQKAKVFISELVPELVDWNKLFLDPFHPDLMSDGRIAVKLQTVSQLIDGQAEAYHAIILKKDEMQSTQPLEESEALFSTSGFSKIHAALKSGGMLALSAEKDDPKLTKMLRKSGFDVSVLDVPAASKGRRRLTNTLWLAKKGAYVSQHMKKKS